MKTKINEDQNSKNNENIEIQNYKNNQFSKLKYNGIKKKKKKKKKK